MAPLEVVRQVADEDLTVVDPNQDGTYCDPADKS